MVAFVAFSHRSFETTLSDGTVIKTTCPSIFASSGSNANCKIVCRTKSGNVGTITLLEDSDSGLAMVMPGADGQHLLFLYYADVRYRLMRIDLNRQPTGFRSDSYLNYIVLSSSWNVEEGTSKDWEEAHSYLKEVPQSVFDRQAVTTCDLGVVRFHHQREELLSEVERQINNSKHGWVY
jgi:hypothetical protein